MAPAEPVPGHRNGIFPTNSVEKSQGGAQAGVGPGVVGLKAWQELATLSFQLFLP